MSNMVVQTNVLALNSHRNMKNVGAVQGRASQRLSSGFRINSAADDAAGLAISEKMRAQIRGLDQASRNAQDGSALLQTAEGGLQEITNMAQRIRELLVQGSNDTLDQPSDDRTKIQGEINNLLSEIDDMAGRVEFNKKTLLNGSWTASEIYFQIGANASQGISVTIGNMDTQTLGINSIDISGDSTGATSTSWLTAVDSAISDITAERAKLGAIQNRLEYTMRSLDISSENLSDSESRVRNTDMAKEMMNFTKANVLQQAAVSMLAQANQLPQNLLQLLR